MDYALCVEKLGGYILVSFAEEIFVMNISILQQAYVSIAKGKLYK